MTPGPALRLVLLDAHGAPRLSLDGSGQVAAPGLATGRTSPAVVSRSGWDAVVIGGGPAGSAFARTMAGAGGRVVLLEQAYFPRDHGGESLLPGIWPVLDELRVSDRVAAAGFVPKAGGTFVVGPDRRRWDVFLGSRQGPPLSRQAVRADLDRILLDHAAAGGAEVRCGWRVVEVLFNGARATGVRTTDEGGREHTIAARWTVDASGDTALLGCPQGLVRFHPGLRNRVVWSYWKGSQRLSGDCAGNTMAVRYPGGWIWHVPLGGPDELAVAGIVAAESEALWSDPDLAARYRAAVAGSEVGSELLAGATPVGEVRTGPATAYCCDRLAGPGWLVAGDSACFVDPLLASGVQLACEHGVLAANALCTLLRFPMLEAEVLAHYEQVYRRQYEDYVQLCLNMYRTDGPHAAGSPADGPPQPPDPDMAARLGFVSLISGLAGPEVLASLAQYTTLLPRPADAPVTTGPGVAGGPGGGHSAEVLDFLFHGLRRRRLALGRAERIRDELDDGVTIHPATGVFRGRLPFNGPPGAGELRFALAVENRFGDRFLSTPELSAVLAESRAGSHYVDVERRVRDAVSGADLDGAAIRRWLELLADHCLIEWQRCAR